MEYKHISVSYYKSEPQKITLDRFCWNPLCKNRYQVQFVLPAQRFISCVSLCPCLRIIHFLNLSSCTSISKLVPCSSTHKPNLL